MTEDNLLSFSCYFLNRVGEDYPLLFLNALFIQLVIARNEVTKQSNTISLDTLNGLPRPKGLAVTNITIIFTIRHPKQSEESTINKVESKQTDS